MKTQNFFHRTPAIIFASLLFFGLFAFDAVAQRPSQNNEQNNRRSTTGRYEQADVVEKSKPNKVSDQKNQVKYKETHRPEKYRNSHQKGRSQVVLNHHRPVIHARPVVHPRPYVYHQYHVHSNMHVIRHLPHHAVRMVLDGNRYYYFDGYFYTKVKSRYYMVAPPQYIHHLPSQCNMVRLGSAVYYHANGIYFERTPFGYRILI